MRSRWDHRADAAVAGRSSLRRAVDRARRLGSDRGLLALLIVGVAALLFAVSMIRAEGFFDSAYDLGAYEQILYTGAHGGGFFDGPDFETYFVPNFFWVHPAPLVFALAPLYGALPFSSTLFAVQAAVMALAALPLYAVGRRAGLAGRWALVPPVLLLTWTPLLAGTLYDFHLEAFLPVGLLTAFALWQRGRYRWGLLASVLPFATLEVGPVFVAMIAVYFLVPRSPSLAAAGRAESGAPPPYSIRHSALRLVRRARGHLASTQARWSLLLLAVSVVAYALLRLWQTGALSAALGHPPATGIPGAPVAYGGWSVGSLGLSAAALGQGFIVRSEHLLLLYALVAFLPLLAPRSLLLAAPAWILVLFYGNPLTFATVGYQHDLLFAFPVGVGLVFGLRRGLDALGANSTVAASAPKGPRPHGSRRPVRWIAAALVCLVAANLLLSPLNPAAQQPGTGAGGYDVSYEVPGGGPQLLALAGLVPDGAPVLASSNLFPLVADDARAFTLYAHPATPPFLPFNLSHPPAYALLSQNSLGDVPTWLRSLVYDPGVYGPRGVVWSSPVGTALLFQLGWSGPVAFWGSPPEGGSIPVTTLVLGPAAALAVNGLVGKEAPSGTTVLSSQGGMEGVVWYGPYTSLAPGRYTVHLTLSASAWGGAAPPTSSTVLEVQVGAYGLGNWVDVSFGAGDLLDMGVVTRSYSFTVPAPATNVEVRGYQWSTGSLVDLYALEIGPSTSGGK